MVSAGQVPSTVIGEEVKCCCWLGEVIVAATVGGFLGRVPERFTEPDSGPGVPAETELTPKITPTMSINKNSIG